MDDGADFGLIVVTGLMSRGYSSHMFLPRHVAFRVFAFILLHKVTFQESSLDSGLILPKSNGVVLKFIEVRAGVTPENCAPK
jgi:hypothetical protein